MKKKRVRASHATHAKAKHELKKSKKPEALEITPGAVQEEHSLNPFPTIIRFFKKEPAPQERLVTTLAQGPPPKLELIDELNQLISSKDDAVNKLYVMDIIVRKYFSKEYKVGKRLPYAEMILQLEKKEQTSASNILKKVIEYAYSGKPLEDLQMHELLIDFKKLIIEDVARKRAEKEALRLQRNPKAIQKQEALADKLMSVSPQLPPSTQPMFHIPTIDLKNFRNKVRSVIDKLKNIRPTKVFTRVQLPNKPARQLLLSKETSSPHAVHHLPQIHWPELKLPEFSSVMVSPINVKHLSLSTVHLHHLELPKVALPHINIHDNHGPRIKLSTLINRIKNTIPTAALKNRIYKSARIIKKNNLIEKLPVLRLPDVNVNLPQLKLPDVHIKSVHLPHPQISASRLRRALHLPKFHPLLYYERIKENISEFPVSEYVHTVTDHIPKIHPREYYESVKETASATWEKIHPPKPTEEEIALQAEIAEEQVAQEAEALAQSAAPNPNTSPVQSLKKKPVLVLPVPQVIAPEKYWIEYKPRRHGSKVGHHFAYEIDDVHHVKSLLKNHHKAGLI